MGDTGFTLGQTAHTPFEGCGRRKFAEGPQEDLKDQKVLPDGCLLILVINHHSIKIKQNKVYLSYLKDTDIAKFIIIVIAYTI